MSVCITYAISITLSQTIKPNQLIIYNMPVQTRSQTRAARVQLHLPVANAQTNEADCNFVVSEMKHLIAQWQLSILTSDRIALMYKFGMNVFFKIPGFIKHVNQTNIRTYFRLCISMYNRMKLFSTASSVISRDTVNTLSRVYGIDIHEFEYLMSVATQSLETEFANTGLTLSFEDSANGIYEAYAITKKQHTFYF